jgi:hypothetical protein
LERIKVVLMQPLGNSHKSDVTKTWAWPYPDLWLPVWRYKLFLPHILLPRYDTAKRDLIRDEPRPAPCPWTTRTMSSNNCEHFFIKLACLQYFVVLVKMNKYKVLCLDHTSSRLSHQPLITHTAAHPWVRDSSLPLTVIL